MSARLIFAVSAAALLSSGQAHAHGGAGGAQLPPDAPAVAPDGEKAKQLLDSIAASDATAREVAEGKRALGRAHGASLAGDRDGSRLLSRLALAWAGAAEAILGAAKAEKAADASEQRAKDAAEKLARAKVMLSETEARRGQLEAELERVRAAEKKAAEDAAVTEKKRVSTPPKKSPKKGGSR